MAKRLAKSIASRGKLRHSAISAAAVNAAREETPGKVRRRLALLAQRDFKNFYAGYVTSLLGTAMSRIALIFAVLDNGRSATQLGYVLAASVLPQVLVMLGGGVLADRIGRRLVMLTTDASRLAVQGMLAAALFLGSPPLWLFLLLSGLLSIGDGFFTPALGGLRAEIAPPDRLPDANALLSVAESATSVIGPALAGVLVALSNPAVVIALDAATYGVSVVALASLTIPAAGLPVQSPWRDFADSWRQFKAQTWLWVTTMQYALFNLFTWAPYLLLGPVLARAYLGGAWPTSLLGFAAGYAALSSAVVLAVPAIRSTTWRNPSPAPTCAATTGSHSENY